MHFFKSGSILFPSYCIISSKNSCYYFSNALGHSLYLMFDIICLRFDIMEKRLISSYDEENDTFVGKIGDENGYVADYGISKGIYLGINDSNLPAAVLIPNASKVLNTSKSVLESSDVRIGIDCDNSCLTFRMCIEGLLVFSTKCKNNFGIPDLNYLIDCNL